MLHKDFNNVNYQTHKVGFTDFVILTKIKKSNHREIPYSLVLFFV